MLEIIYTVPNRFNNKKKKKYDLSMPHSFKFKSDISEKTSEGFSQKTEGKIKKIIFTFCVSFVIFPLN